MSQRRNKEKQQQPATTVASAFSPYLNGGTFPPATPYAAGLQARQAEPPERKEKEKEREKEKEKEKTASKTEPYLAREHTIPSIPYAASLQAGQVKIPERTEKPATEAPKLEPYLARETPTPSIPYAASLQAGLVKPPVRMEKPKEKPPAQEEGEPLAWETLMENYSAAELDRQHEAAKADRNALYDRIAAVEKESAGPNSTSAASAGLYKPREENPIPSSAAASGAWVNQAAQELAALRGEAGQKQAEVSDLAAAHYFRKNREQFARLETDAYSKVNYATAKELAADLDTLDKALNNPTSYNGQDTRFNSAGEAVLRKYGATDLQRLRDTLAMRKEELVEALADRGYDFETMAGYDRMLVQQETYLRMQEEWSKEAEEHPFLASGLSVLLAPLRSVDALKAWGNGIGHSNADNLDSYIPFNVYEMQATNMVQTVRKTVSDEIKNIFDWELFGQNVAVFLYNTGMNIMDKAFQKAAFGDVATIVLMGCSSAAETTKRVIERGGSNEQAFWLGLSAGAVEIVIDQFSAGDIPKLKNARSWEEALKAVSVQVGIPASKGMLTELSNILADTAVMGDRSRWADAARKYEKQGLSPNDAWLQAALDNLVRIGEAGVKNFMLSGLE